VPAAEVPSRRTTSNVRPYVGFDAVNGSPNGTYAPVGEPFTASNAEVTDCQSGDTALRSSGHRTLEEISAVTDRRTLIIARTGSATQSKPKRAVRHLLPAPDRRLADAGRPHDLGSASTVGGQQHDLGAPHVLLGAIPIRYDRVQADTDRRAYVDGDAGSHPPDSHRLQPRGTLSGLKCQI
jgi:hypothetical protein